MEIKKQNNIYIVIAFAIILFLVLSNIGTIFSKIGGFFALLTPFFWGLGIAFILNGLLKFFENTVFKGKFFCKPFFTKHKRSFSLAATYLSFLIFFYIVFAVILPTIISNITLLITKIPAYITTITNWYNDLEVNNEFLSAMLKDLPSIDEIFNSVKTFLINSIPKIYGFTLTFTGGLLNLFIGIIFSVYMLSAKEKLILISKKLLYSFISKEKMEKFLDFGHEFNVTLQKFIGGQLTEALILGTLCAFGVWAFRISPEYAPIIGLIIGLTNIIPLLGPWLGAIPSTLLILLESPVKALWFVVFILVIQQVDNNLIYPRVVGNAIGISGFFVLLGITIGGSLFGVVGMVFGAPIMALAYTFLSRYIDKRLKRRHISI